MKLKQIVVFCASSPGFENSFVDAAKAVGKAFVDRDIQLVYGGGRVGLMGAVADSVMEHGGVVVGVIPQFLNSKEIGHSGITQLIEVDTMHERKAKMNALCDGIIALPGGFGTMEELFEMITWAQLGLHKKPVGILNVDGFYDHLIQFIQQMVDTGLLKEENQKMLQYADNIDELIDLLEQYEAPPVPKWLNIERS
ncbi:TIGR00730 family Rossman fold protein [Sphingobacterium sp. UBA6645]|uniref:LOG family protein n=1 Tax=Sphingobacterium sp. UBA6645 TaxID=1947511 RepID=UPI0025FCF05E|nr:TIGR00730 family Rossman fold protein [Sphingobacterium sp. UBA6645]